MNTSANSESRARNPRAIVLASILLALVSSRAMPQSEQLAAPIAGDIESVATLDEVLVTGEQPGPDLWKVSKGEHTLWILGSYGPLPKKMTWRSKNVEEIVSESQRVVAWVTIDTDVDIGFFAGLAALPSLMKAGNNPDDAELKDVLPPDLYAQWQPLKAKYIGRDNDVEALRPAFAALQLQSKAREYAGLSSESVIWPTVERLAKKHKIKIVRPEVTMKLKIEKPRAVIKKFRKTQLADVECFGQTLTRIESDVEAMKTRANAWSVGDLDKLRKLPEMDSATDCTQLLRDLMLNGQLADELGAREMLDKARLEYERTNRTAEAVWLKAVEDSIGANATSFAVVPVARLLDPKGPLTVLRDHGYEIDEP